MFKASCQVTPHFRFVERVGHQVSRGLRLAIWRAICDGKRVAPARMLASSMALMARWRAGLAEPDGGVGGSPFAMAMHGAGRNGWLFRALDLFCFGIPFRAWPAPPDCCVEIAH